MSFLIRDLSQKLVLCLWGKICFSHNIIFHAAPDNYYLWKPGFDTFDIFGTFGKLSAALPFANPNAFTVGAANPLSEKGYFLLFNHQFEIE